MKEGGRILGIRNTIKKRVGIFVNVLCMISVSRTFLSISCFFKWTNGNSISYYMVLKNKKQNPCLLRIDFVWQVHERIEIPTL